MTVRRYVCMIGSTQKRTKHNKSMRSKHTNICVIYYPRSLPDFKVVRMPHVFKCRVHLSAGSYNIPGTISNHEIESKKQYLQ